MYQRFKNSISNPKMVFFYVKDSFLRVLSYILMLTILLSLPFIITVFTNKDFLFPDKNDIVNGIENNFYGKGIKVIDNKLVLDNQDGSYNFTVNNYTFVIGVIPRDSQMYVVELGQSEVTLYTNVNGQIMMPIISTSYAEDYDFDDNAILLYNDLVKVLNENTTLVTFTVTSVIIGYLIEIIMFALIMASIAVIFKKLPLPFKAHFKVAIYLLTPWVILNTILMLFNLSIFTFMSFVIIYVYHVIAYRSVRIISTLGVGKKDEEE